MSQSDNGRRRKAKPYRGATNRGSSVEPSVVPLMNDDWAYAESVDLSNPAKPSR